MIKTLAYIKNTKNKENFKETRFQIYYAKSKFSQNPSYLVKYAFQNINFNDNIRDYIDENILMSILFYMSYLTNQENH